VTGPLRLRKYSASTEPYVFRSPFGPVFELEPGQFLDRKIVENGLFEERFLEFMRSILTPQSVVVDIGANIGNHALYLARKCRSVHCFEPNPSALRRLYKNIELNRAVNVTVHEFGLGERDEVAAFYENTSDNLAASGFVERDGRRSDLPLRNADQAISELNLTRLDFIKIDVEGMEESVFRGLQQTIARHRPLIDFEFLGQRRGPADFDAIRRLLPGYRILEPRFSPSEGSILKRLAWNIRKAGQADLVPVEVPEGRPYENLLAMPS
jgi:FkbM family methyltransferase